MSIFRRLFGRANVHRKQKASGSDVSDLIHAALSEDWESQYKAISELKSKHEAGDGRVIAQLLDSLRDPDWEVRFKAIEIIADERVFWEDPRVAEPIRLALKDDNARVRYRAAYALSDMQYAPAAPDLIAALDDDDESVQEYAVYALGEICVPQAVRPLKQLLPTATDKVKKRIASAIDKIDRTFGA